MGVVKSDFGPETKLSIFKKKGAGVNAVGFKYEYNIVKMVNSYTFKKGDKIKIEVDNVTNNQAVFYLNNKPIAKANLNDVGASSFRIAIVSF